MSERSAIRAELTLDLPAELLWRHLADFSRYPDWNPVFTRVAGSLCPGALLRVTVRPLPFLFVPFTARITDLEEGSAFTWQARLLFGLLIGTHTFRVEPLASGRCTLRQREWFSGPLAPLLRPLLHLPLSAAYRRLHLALGQRAATA